jgi:ribonucleoside-diphosphate reductase alpha chain
MKTETITFPNGKMCKVTFPENFSEDAKRIVAHKYFYGSDDNKIETDFSHLVDRVVYTNALWLAKTRSQYIDEEERSSHAYFWQQIDSINVADQWAWKDFSHINQEDMPPYIAEHIEHLKDMIYTQRFAFNSPVWFNIGNPYAKPQVPACFILGVEDNIESISESFSVEMEIYRSGSGSGTNYSKLRSSKERISGGGLASGPCSFMKISDVVAAVTKSGGKTRRAAQMKILNIDHGDIEEFITQKSREEDKAYALIREGYDSSFDNPEGAYGSVFFQNSNQSVRVTDKFMKCVEKDEDWYVYERYPVRDLKFYNAVDKGYKKIADAPQGVVVTNGTDTVIFPDQSDEGFKVIKVYKARYLMDLIAEMAWKCGDPGLQFHDTVNWWHTCRNDGEITGSNPCSEYMFLDDTSCNLGSLKLTAYYDVQTGKFDFDLYRKDIQTAITAMDAWIDYSWYPSSKIAEETKKYRTLGLGYTDLGALLMKMGIAYGSPEAIEITAALTAIKTYEGYLTSHRLAKETEPFPRFKYNSMTEVLTNHYHSLGKFESKDNAFMHEAFKLREDFLRMVKDEDFAVRNAQISVIAPTGTISFMMDAHTTGIEPPIALKAYKTLVGGGTLTLTIPEVKDGLKALGYKDAAVNDLIDVLENEGEEEFLKALKPSERPVFATALSNVNPVPVEAHLKMMAAVQPFISGAISKTVNVPNYYTAEDIKNIYIKAWKLGLKAIAVYRDGSKGSQPVKVKDEKPREAEARKDNGRFRLNKLPETRDSLTHKFSIGGVKGYMIVGFYENNKPGEIFLKINKEGSTISGLADSWAKTMSIAMQAGVPVEYLVEEFKHMRFEPAGFTNNKDIRVATSIVDYVVRFLELVNNSEVDPKTRSIDINENVEKVEPEGNDEVKLTGDICSLCGGNLIQTGSCKTCRQCGATTGCG